MEKQKIIEVTQDGNKYINICFYLEEASGNFTKIPAGKIENYKTPEYLFIQMEESEFINSLEETPFKYGLIIKKFRLKKGLTMDELADRIDTTKALLSKVENGKDFRINTWCRIVKVLDIKIAINAKDDVQISRI